jgi:DNA invertase Pin-like site-specific DNA recombinase
LLDAGVDVRFADLPALEGATGKFMLQQMAAIAELEAGMISARTKATLAAAKRRGVKLGGFRGVKFTAKHIKLAVATRREKAAQRAADSLRAIAAALDERGIPAARGGKWSAV